MSLARGHSIERGFRLGLAGLFACLSCSGTEVGAGGNGGASGNGGTSVAGTAPATAGSATAGQSAGGSATAGQGASGSATAGQSAGGSATAGQSAGGSSAGLGGNTGVGGAGAGIAGSDTASNAGKSGACEIMECFAANFCLDKCGGNVVYVGCCSCEPPLVDSITCSN
jgi:hypothetical protein